MGSKSGIITTDDESSSITDSIFTGSAMTYRSEFDKSVRHIRLNEIDVQDANMRESIHSKMHAILDNAVEI